MDQRRIVSDVDIFDGKGRDFGNENTTERIGDGGVEADEREGRVVWVGGGVNLDLEVLESSQHERSGVCCYTMPYFFEVI